MLTFSSNALFALVSLTATNCNSTPHSPSYTPHAPKTTVTNPFAKDKVSTSIPSILPHLSTNPTNSPENSHWGDTIHRSPDELHRIYFQNLDGLRNDNEEIDLYVESMLHYQVGTFCWTDPSLDFLQSTAKAKITSHTLSHFKTARTAFSSSRLPNERDSCTNQAEH